MRSPTEKQTTAMDVPMSGVPDSEPNPAEISANNTVFSTLSVLQQMKDDVQLQPAHTLISMPKEVMNMLLSSAITSTHLSQEVSLLKSTIANLQRDNAMLIRKTNSFHTDTGLGFFRFGRLPVEIRTMIWQAFSQIPTIMHISFQVDQYYFQTKLPPIYRVCRESRQLALKTMTGPEITDLRNGIILSDSSFLENNHIIPYSNEDEEHNSKSFIGMLASLALQTGHIAMSLKAWHQIVRSLTKASILRSFLRNDIKWTTIVVGPEVSVREGELTFERAVAKTQSVFEESYKMLRPSRIGPGPRRQVAPQPIGRVDWIVLRNMWVKDLQAVLDQCVEDEVSWLADTLYEEESEDNDDESNTITYTSWELPQIEFKQFA